MLSVEVPVVLYQAIAWQLALNDNTEVVLEVIFQFSWKKIVDVCFSPHTFCMGDVGFLWWYSRLLLSLL